jgi:hypothetical protein
LVDQLAPGGRLLLAVPFGSPYPSQLIAQLRGSTVPLDLELTEGELRLAVEKKKPHVGSWQNVASPGRLLALTERGASERDTQRAAELDTLRSAYKKLAERLMARASDQAGPSLAAASRVTLLEDKVADLAARLRTVDESRDVRVGRALLSAGRSPRDAVALPLRLLRALAERQRSLPALPPPAPIDRELTSLVRRSSERLVLIVDGRRTEEAGPLSRELSMEGWSVVLAAIKESEEMKPAQKVVHTEIDLLADVFPLLERADAAHRLALFRTPHPIAPRWINRLNAWGWTTIYDCFEDWPEKLRLMQPHRYRRAVERFIVANVDLICATEAAAERLRSLTSREPIIIDDIRPEARSQALMEAASQRRASLVEKSFHERDA